MITLVTDTKAAPAIARAVPAAISQWSAWFEKKLPAQRPAMSIGLIHLHTQFPAYARARNFICKRPAKKPSYNKQMQPTLAPQAALRLPLRGAADLRRSAT